MSADKFHSSDVLFPYYPPIVPEVYGLLSFALVSMGLFLVSWFFIIQTGTSRRSKRSALRQFIKETFMSISASFFLGFGSFFGLLAVGMSI